MSDISFETVCTLFGKQEWKIIDKLPPQEVKTGFWSVIARTTDGVRVSIDEPPEELQIDNIIIEGEIQQISTVQEYEEATSIAEEYESVYVQVQSAEGLFHRAKASKEVDLSNKEIVGRLKEKEVPFGLQFIISESTADIGLESVLDLVQNVQSAQEQLIT